MPQLALVMQAVAPQRPVVVSHVAPLAQCELRVHLQMPLVVVLELHVPLLQERFRLHTFWLHDPAVDPLHA